MTTIKLAPRMPLLEAGPESLMDYPYPPMGIDHREAVRRGVIDRCHPIRYGVGWYRCDILHLYHRPMPQVTPRSWETILYKQEQVHNQGLPWRVGPTYCLEMPALQAVASDPRFGAIAAIHIHLTCGIYGSDAYVKELFGYTECPVDPYIELWEIGRRDGVDAAIAWASKLVVLSHL